MAYKNKIIQEKLRIMTNEAVSNGVRKPDELAAYLLDNGWAYELPTRPTLIAALNFSGVEFVHGYWEKVKR
jgi:hypothetical protein